MPPLHAHPRPLQPRVAARAGFSLVEVLVVVVAISLGLVGIASLTAIGGRNQAQLNTSNRRADAINADIAEVRRINDRYTCAALTVASGGSCVINPSDVDQDGFYPTNANGRSNFADRCNYNGTGVDLVTGLAALIPTSSSASATLTAADVTRTIDTANQGSAHRYTVTYSADGNTIATLTLVPTTAAWCP
jgi:prepilin-type N-terminal cleavage/methylation domain-containing protein